MQAVTHSKALDAFLILYAVVLLVVSFFIEPMHDYALYFAHWDLILGGGDPWAKIDARNAYGPIYNIFALPYALHSQLPKLLFVSCWLVLSLYTVREFSALPRVKTSVKSLFAVFWLLNPFFIVCTAFYGFNDSLVALLCFIGILVAAQGKSKSALVWMTMGILTKLYPLFLLPFLNKDWKDIRRNIALFFAILLIGYFITYLIWGSSFVTAFGKANGRNPTLFSIMMFFYGDYFPFETLAKVLIGLGTGFVLGSIWWVFKRYQNGKPKRREDFHAETVDGREIYGQNTN